MGNTSQATERSPHWEGFLPGVPWSLPSPRGQKRLQMLREELVQATIAPKNSLRQGAGKNCWRCCVKARLADNWAASPNPARGEKPSPGRSRCHNGLGENGTSAIGWQFLPRISHQSLCLLQPKILAAFPSPTCQEELCSEPSSHTVFSKLPLTPHLFQETFKPEYPLPTLDVLCLVWHFFFPLPLCLWNTITSGQALLISLALDPFFLVCLLFRAPLWTSLRSCLGLLWLIVLQSITLACVQERGMHSHVKI